MIHEAAPPSSSFFLRRAYNPLTVSSTAYSKTRSGPTRPRNKWPGKVFCVELVWREDGGGYLVLKRAGYDMVEDIVANLKADDVAEYFFPCVMHFWLCRRLCFVRKYGKSSWKHSISYVNKLILCTPPFSYSDSGLLQYRAQSKKTLKPFWSTQKISTS